MKKLDDWYDNLLSRRSATLAKQVCVEGVREAHLGPRWEFARVVVNAEPSPSFSAQCDPRVSVEHEEFVRAAIFGMLDVLLVADPAPLREVCLRVVEVDVHAMDSSTIAFRRAGRDAATKLLEHIASQTGEIR